MEPVGIYLHVPFCVRKCRYCDFLSFPSDEETMRKYAAALREEIRLTGLHFENEYRKRLKADTVFIGGGTPTALPADCLKGLTDQVRESFDVEEGAEVTVEMNPGTFGKGGYEEGLLDFITGECSRASIGLQSADEAELQVLGRIHTFAEFEECFAALRSRSFKNISADLIFALPGQTLASWERTLTKAAALSPEHISAYSLILEEGTEFMRLMRAGKFSGKYALPDEDTEREMAHFAEDFLKSRGYARYEISNFAKPGFESRHNLRYWRRRDYLGMGLGAASLYEETRYSNTADLGEYIKGVAEASEAARACGLPENGGGTPEPRAGRAEGTEAAKAAENTAAAVKTIREPEAAEGGTGRGRSPKAGPELLLPAIRKNIERLTLKARMEEFMFLGLRTARGISSADFERSFGRSLEEVYGKALGEAAGQGLMDAAEEGGGTRFFLTRRGVDVSNAVLAGFLLD